MPNANARPRHAGQAACDLTTGDHQAGAVIEHTDAPIERIHSRCTVVLSMLNRFVHSSGTGPRSAEVADLEGVVSGLDRRNQGNRLGCVQLFELNRRCWVGVDLGLWCRSRRKLRIVRQQVRLPLSNRFVDLGLRHRRCWRVRVSPSSQAGRNHRPLLLG